MSIVLAIALLAWGWLDVRQRGYAWPDRPDDHKTDLTVYTEAGAAFFDGRAPYEVANPRGWIYLYPPLLALLVAPLGYLEPQNQVFVWYLISLGFCLGCYIESRRLFEAVVRYVGGPGYSGPPAPPASIASGSGDCSAARTRDCPGGVALLAGGNLKSVLGWGAFAAALLPTLNCLQRGQVGVLKLYLLLLGVRVVLTSRSRWGCLAGGAILALPAVMKIIPALPAGVFLLAVVAGAWARRRRNAAAIGQQRTDELLDQSPAAPVPHASMVVAGAAAGVLLLLFVLPGAVLGWKNNLGHLKTWAAFMLTKADHGGLDPRSGNSRSVRNQSLQNAVARLGNFAMYLAGQGPDDRDVPLTADRPLPPMPTENPATQACLIFARVLLLAAVLMAAWRLGSAGTGLDLAAAFAVGCVAMLVISPIARGHYFMLYAPAVIFVPLWLQLHGDPRVWGMPAARVLAVAPAILVNAHYGLLSVAGRIGLLGLGTAGWLLTALVACARATSAAGEGNSRFGELGQAGAAEMAGPLAHLRRQAAA